MNNPGTTEYWLAERERLIIAVKTLMTERDGLLAQLSEANDLVRDLTAELKLREEYRRKFTPVLLGVVQAAEINPLGLDDITVLWEVRRKIERLRRGGLAP